MWVRLGHGILKGEKPVAGSDAGVLSPRHESEVGGSGEVVMSLGLSG